MGILQNLISRFSKRETSAASVFLTDVNGFDELCSNGYTSLDKNPEILTACMKIAELISSMTIYLMANTDKGDIRIKNELSRKVDILPNRDMTRKTWMDFIVMTLLLYGKGNSVVVPHTKNGFLGDLEPIPAYRVSFQQNPLEFGYKILIDGVPRNPDDLLHFVFNPDKMYPWKGAGINLAIADVADNLKQAEETKKGFMKSKWKPSLIVKVDALTDEFSSPEGREKLIESYIKTNGVGQPWMIPAEQIEVQEVRPLSLNDLAISDSVKMDKETVAAILGVPSFIIGVGDYKKDEWDAFISNTIRPIAKGIEQELTRKLLTSEKMYWKLNVASLYSYDMKTTQSVYSELYVRGIVTGNEVRDKMNLAPKDGLDDLVILENYIPLAKIGDQLKLGGDEDS